jgi:hypothetical protein
MCKAIYCTDISTFIIIISIMLKLPAVLVCPLPCKAQASPEVQGALKNATSAGLRRIQAYVPVMGRLVNGWSVMTEAVGVYGTSYLKRAAVALMGLGANLPEDAVYPSR